MYRPVTPSPTPGVPEAFVAPVGGWNARDPQTAMKPTDAVVLDNMFPRETNVVTRLGYSEVEEIAADQVVHSLIHFEYGTIDKIIAGCNDKLWNAETGVELSSTTYDSDEWIGDVMSGKLFLVNGVDDMQEYDGTTIGAATFSGGPSEPFTYVKAYKSRIYAAEKNSQKVWYGPLAGITGSLTSFDLSLVGGFSGSLLAIKSLSRDGGKDNRDDMIAFIFTSGDVAVYSGSNPADAAEWSLHGRFKIGRPLGKYAFHETETDLYVLTNRGYEQLSRTMPQSAETTKTSLLSDKISTAVTDAIKLKPFDSGWRIITVPAEAMMVVNVPGLLDTPVQHVRNVNTGSWCRFKDIDIRSMCMKGQYMYFGTSDGRVMRYGDATTDNGSAIKCEAQTAWSALRSPVNKLITHAHLMFVAAYMPPISVGLGVNFVEPRKGVQSSFSGANDTPARWDTAVWDVARWAAESRTFDKWVMRPVRGRFVSARLIFSSVGRIQWNSITYLIQRGGLM